MQYNSKMKKKNDKFTNGTTTNSIKDTNFISSELHIRKKYVIVWMIMIQIVPDLCRGT